MKNVWLWNHYGTDMYRNEGGRHYWFAQNLINKGYDATIFCANTYHNKLDFIDTSNKKYAMDILNDIPFVFVKTTTALGNGLDRLKNMGMFYWNLHSVSKQYAKQHGKPDVILASSVHPLTMVAGIQVARKFKIPCICEVRDLWPEAIFAFNKAKENSLLGRVLVKGEHWIYKNADALIFTKEGDTDYILEKKWDKNQGGDIDLAKTHYINNGVDLNKFNFLSREKVIKDYDLSTEKFKIIYTGAIRPVNDVGSILDAAKLLEEYDDIVFLIYGEGTERAKLEKRIIEEKITNVKIKGFVNKENIPYVLSKSNVNLLNYSQTEYNWARGNSSNKLFEYMASGKPVISTVKMGYSIIEKYKCGYEIEDNTPENLANAILKIKEMPSSEYNRFCDNAKKGAEDFDFNKLTEKLIKVICNLIN